MSLIIIKDPLHKDYSRLFEKVFSNKPQSIDVYLNGGMETVEQLSSVLASLYDNLRAISIKHGYDHKFSIDVLFNPPDFGSYSNTYAATEETLEDVFVTKIDCELSDCSYPTEETIGKFDVVAVGGTFDHLHDGHKMLLSAAMFLAKKKLIVGITDDELLKNKKYKEYLQSFEQRLDITIKFLQKIGGGQKFELYKIVDVCGPTGYIKDIDCLVLSTESASGGEYVNNYRESIGYPKLEVFAIDLIGDGEQKLSSTDLRKIEFVQNEAKSWDESRHRDESKAKQV